METLVQTYRLDAQEQQIKQLQGDVAKIKTSLKLLEEELVESREFRKVVLNWMHHQDSRSNFRSISQFSDTSSGSVSPPSSFSAQLEAFIARSEERLGKSLLHTGCGSKSRPESVNWALSTAENTFVHDRFEEASATNSMSDTDHLKAIIYRFEETSADHGYLMLNSHSDSIFSGSNSASAAPIAQFQSPRAHIVGVRSKSHEIGVISGRSQGNLGFRTVVLGSDAVLGLGIFNIRLADLPPKLFDLDPDPEPPDRHTPSLSAPVRVLSSQLWVVHGQCRPPEDSTKEISVCFWSSLSDSSLEDKTVLKGGVLIEIAYILVYFNSVRGISVITFL
ncbi:hypothetical protein HanRHA438_Chr14g0652971 [Helianthus annuus]|nr:hypothetical protein HanIR_Chr14g0696831 [Helianthus annuus]KAJ0853593.1 hypothetical protein HanRHA438_Chr14g0652971 [Helianthus annuus]